MKDNPLKDYIRALKISHQDISKCLHHIGILSGGHHFTDLWARDGFFASYGVNLIGKSEYTKKTLELFLHHQRSDGLLPYRLQRSPTTLSKYRGKPKYFSNPVPNFRSHQSGGIVPDGGLMTIIGFREYIKQTNDVDFLKKNITALHKTINWYQKKYKENLINEWFMCEWADAVLKVGKTLYTNILYWKALIDLSDLSGKLKLLDYSKIYKLQAEKIRKLIINQFWNGTFFSDWIDYKRHDYFASSPNFLSIWWGLASPKQSQSIIEFTEKHCRNNFTVETNYPKYVFWRIPLINHLGRMSDYHNRGCLWLQPGILYSLCLKKTGKLKMARKALENISRHILLYKGVYEVYERNNVPLNRRWYTSEHPFAWSAGLYIYAHHYLVK